MKEVLCRGDRKRSRVPIIDKELANREACICEYLAEHEKEGPSSSTV